MQVVKSPAGLLVASSKHLLQHALPAMAVGITKAVEDQVSLLWPLCSIRSPSPAPPKTTWSCLSRKGHNTDPTDDAVKDCTSNERNKTTKRNSDKSFERASKRSRANQSLSEGCCQARRPSTPDIARLRIETDERKSTKRKSEETEQPSKRSRTSQGSSEGCCQARRPSTPDIARLRIETDERKSSKRKSEETEEPSKRCRKTFTRSKTPSDQATEASSSDKPGTSSPATIVPSKSRAVFEAKYKQGEKLGQGGYGLVFAGYRTEDNVPVAIKRMSQQEAKRTTLSRDGRISNVPMEVLLLLKVKPAAGETSAVVALLDWYDLDNELILILERPVPCMDLACYVYSGRFILREHIAKIITQQLVNALIDIHSKGVFHRDIKLDNILLEMGSDVPRVRIVDFGCGTYLKPGMYRKEQGTYVFSSPEWFLHRCYRAEPTTVWQIGVVLFEMLHKYLPFCHSHNIIHDQPQVRNNISSNCKGFLLSCLAKKPQARPTLERLKHHPWLVSD